MIKKLISFLVVTSTVLGCFTPVFSQDEAVAAPEKDFQIYVETDERQTYEGFGWSAVGNLDDLSDRDRETAYKLIFDDLKTNCVRFWFEMNKYYSDENNYNLSPFVERYRKGVINYIIENDIKILLAPTKYANFMLGDDINPETGEKESYTTLKPSMVDAYAKGLATAIHDLKFEYGWPVYATGVYNEPNMKGYVMAAVIPLLRKYLDEMDCKEVLICAPETANNDTSAFKIMETLLQSEDAWSNIDMLGSHSYNMAFSTITADYASKLESKRLWQTESSTTGMDDGYGNAVTTAARYINDLNHWCTEWMYFQSFDTRGANGTVMGGFDSVSHKAILQPKYWYVKQITNLYDEGAVFYHSTSDQEGEMHFTYGIKNRVYSATAQNPDGRWAISVVNATDTTQHNAWMSDASSYKKQNALQADITANVTLNIFGLSESGKQEFKVIRTSRTANMQEEENVVADNGVIKLRLNAGDLVTLKSVNPIEKVDAEVEFEEYTEEELILPDKPLDMTDGQYDLWIQGSEVLGYDKSKLPNWTPEYKTVTKRRVKVGSSGEIGGSSIDSNFVSVLLGSPYVSVKGKKMAFSDTDKSLIASMYDGKMYVPVRFVELLGGKASYDNKLNKISIELNGNKLESYTDKKGMTINAVYSPQKASAKIINGRVYIPLRELAEGIGKTVHWDDRGLAIIIDENDVEKVKYSIIDKFIKKAEEAADGKGEETEMEPMQAETSEERDEKLVSTSSVDKNVTELLVGSPFVFVKGKEMQFDSGDNSVVTAVYDEASYVPVRLIEMLGGKATYNNDSQKLSIWIGAHFVECYLGQKKITVNGVPKTTKNPIRVVNNRICIPLRELAENTGKTLVWDNRGLIILSDKIEMEKLVYGIIEKLTPVDETVEVVDDNV